MHELWRSRAFLIVCSPCLMPHFQLPQIWISLCEFSSIDLTRSKVEKTLCDYGYECNQLSLFSHSVTIRNPVSYFSCESFFWVELKASKWLYFSQIHSTTLWRSLVNDIHAWKHLCMLIKVRFVIVASNPAVTSKWCPGAVIDFQKCEHWHLLKEGKYLFMNTKIPPYFPVIDCFFSFPSIVQGFSIFSLAIARDQWLVLRRINTWG